MPVDAKRDRVYAIVLAAGAATRFGSSKQLADFDGEPLARRASRIASDVFGDRSILVTGHAWNAVRIACQPYAGFFIVNDEYTRGLGSSLAHGIAAVRHAASAVMVLLADQPLITADHLRALLAAWSCDDREIIGSAYSDTAGVPALFPAGCFDRLGNLDGDAGARSLMRDPDYCLRKVEFPDAATDVDTPADLVRSLRNAHS